MITEDDVKKIAPQAERITFNEGAGFVVVGLKVGLFAQGVNISYNKNHESQKQQVRDLYLDLMAMNREQDKQRKEAQDEYSKLIG